MSDPNVKKTDNSLLRAGTGGVSKKDVIYRQDAIDAVNEWFRLYVTNRSMSNVTSIQDILRQLPSAEPKKEKEKCSNKLPCGWCSLFDASCDW